MNDALVRLWSHTRGFYRRIKEIVRRPVPVEPTGDADLDFALETGPRAFDPDLPKHLRLEIAKRSTLGPYREILKELAQNQVAIMHAEIREIGRQNRQIERKATITHVPHCRIPLLVWDFFEMQYGQGCWQDEDFMEDFLKHHPECRITVKRGIRGQEYVNGRATQMTRTLILLFAIGTALVNTASADNCFITNDSSKPVPIASAPLPQGATAKSGSSGNVANASAVATLAAVSGKTNYLTGFQCTAAGATAALVVNVTVTGVISGTLTYTFVFPAGVTTQANSLIVTFDRPLPASATNTAITVTLPASGAGGTNAAVNVQGFDL